MVVAINERALERLGQWGRWHQVERFVPPLDGYEPLRRLAQTLTVAFAGSQQHCVRCDTRSGSAG